MASSNRVRALNRLPFDFQDGLKINGVDVSDLTGLQTPAGAGLVGYMPAGAGAVASTVEQELRKVVRATDCGADSTGVTDCSVQLQAVIDSIPAEGGSIDFGSGTYLVNETVDIPKSGLYLYGNGAKIVNGTVNAPAFYFGDGIVRYYGNSVSGLVFTSTPGSAAGQVGLVFKKQGQLKVQNIVFDDRVDRLYRGVIFDDVYQYKATKLEAQNTKEHGIVMLNSGDGKLTDCRSDGNAQTGFWLNGCEGHTFMSVFAYDNGTSGWRIVSDNPAVRSNKNCWFVACVGDTSASYNWTITDLKDSYFTSTWASSQSSTVINTFATGFYLGSNQVKNIQFNGGCAYNNNNHGVQIDSTGGAPENIRFVGFDFGSTGAALNGNGKAGTGFGLAINGQANEIRIDGTCSFKNNASGAYNNTSSGNDVQFTGNPIGFKVKAKGTATVSDGGTILHGLNITPTWAEVSATYTTELATVTAIDSTTLTVAIKTPAGGAGTTQQVRWEAEF